MFNQTRHQKVVLVGDGAVGSSYALLMLQQPVMDELVIVDIAEKHCVGDSLDLEDTQLWSTPKTVRPGTYADARDADLVVITAGVPRQPGETRLDLVNKNLKILRSIVTPIVASGFAGIFLVAANPVDILTAATQRLSGFPPARVIGTGTSLDTARFKVALAKRLQVAPQQLEVNVIGEHGDTEFAALCAGRLGGRPLLEIAQQRGITNQELMDIEAAARTKGGKIIGLKGATFYGVATCLARISRAILANENAVLPVGAYLDGQYHQHGLYLGTPAVINANGIDHILELPLSPEEQEKMAHSAGAVQSVLSAAFAS
ncbi:L-lactate dehydrogenase [Levilactobacillus enshiensis]|uniref:L-lactate dehydrogenase n=1 Tax=Levilactobacillus enshiensis TaxID=2590213 RepID=UPI00117B3079|nr:L-lactate dehydrogenase [Levilactobacillus enshiensis]